MTAETNTRGLALAGAAQITLLGAWLFSVLGAVTGNNVGFLGLAAALAGFILFTVALFLGQARFGVLGPLAGVIMALAMLAAVVAFIAVPGDNHAWGKLGALVLAVGILGGGVYLAHFVAALALWNAGARALSLVPATLFAGALLLSGLAITSGDELVLFACGLALTGHVVLVIGLARARTRLPTVPRRGADAP